MTERTVERRESLQVGPAPALWLWGRVEVASPGRFRALLPHLGIFLGLTGLFAALGHLTPSPDHVGTHQQLGFPPCSFRAVFGLPCPGCGGTTAVCYMLHGDVKNALVSNVFGAAVFAGLAAVWLGCLISLISRRPLKLYLYGPDGARMIGYTLVLMVLSWLLKIALTLLYPPGIPP